MKAKILLTSFQTWLPHQKSNSSDDLLEILQQQNFNWTTLSYLRQLPVDIQLASEQVISEIQSLEPDGIICCGMAESRNRLTIETNAICQAECLETSVNIVELTNLLTITDLSQDAGKFVCEGLYYQVLKHTQSLQKKIPSIFVHVPKLNESNLNLIHRDFSLIIKYIEELCTTTVPIIY